MTRDQFAAAYTKALNESGTSWTDDDVASSYAAYVKDPAGHFISKEQP